ncbi:hypothetical protein PISL3812_06534 [Talaromyces islandicus]|uniref:NmrA-like domain-containing protein n=1 Tax=Talaromyces islandicus TaxID=28573 RepID=A0A0U1M1Q8_TALIS|nr:hypothetical protein PISL3812_06534 [Talaromyces islandicus]
MDAPVIVVVGALGAQGGSVVSAYLASERSKHFRIRALTSSPSSDAALKLAANPRVTVVGVDLDSPESISAAFQDASLIFANTIFNPEAFLKEGAAAAQELEASHGLNIAQAASKIPSLKHLIWSTLPDSLRVTDGKYVIPHFQSKIPAERYLSDPKNGMESKTTYLHVGLYGSNLERVPYLPIYMPGAQKYVITLPCSPDAIIPFVGDETLNVGLIAEAIFNQPEKTVGQSVLGVSEHISCTEWALALSKALEGKKTPTTETVFIETTLESYKALWGQVLGTEIGIMFAYFNHLQERSFGSSTVLTPADLGIQASLRSTEQRLQDMDWETLLA